MKKYLFPVHLFLKNKRKKDHNPGPYLGQEFTVPRNNKRDVPVRLYRPVDAGADETLPVLFNVHGGGWLFGDAEGVDLQSQYLANHLHCFVVNMNYMLADENPFPYQQEEIADGVEYFLAHAAEHGFDPAKCALMGYSAGGHISAGAAILLRDRGVNLQTQVLCYPFLDYIGFDFGAYGGLTGFKRSALNWLSNKVLFEKLPKDSLICSPAHAEPDALRGLARAVIVTCGAGDPLLPQGEKYVEKLRAAGVETVYKMYPDATHGFLERNFKDDPAVFAHEDRQDTLLREAVDFIASQHIFG